jgi:hypothetical protein
MCLVGAVADKARAAIVISYLRDADRVAATEPLRGGLPRLATIEVTAEEVGPNAVRLDEASRRSSWPWESTRTRSSWSFAE